MTESGDTGWESIPAMAAATAAEHPDLPAIVDRETVTYAQLHERARHFAGSLVASGVEPGDRVAIWAFNSAEWIIAALGTWQAGAVVVPINTRFKAAEAVDILSRSEARVLVTVTDFLGVDYVTMLQSSGAELPSLGAIVVASGSVPGGSVAWDDFLARSTDQARSEVDRRIAALGGDDPADILFTSGTTGIPKGVVQTHSRTLCVGTDWPVMTGLRTGDRYLMINPYFHMFGLKGGIVACISVGATMYPEATFDVDRVMARVAEEQITVLPGAPTMYQSILDYPGRDKHDLSSLRIAVTGAAEIPVELIRRMHEELPFSVIITGYGLTEGGTAAATSADDDFNTIATTVGRPRPGFELRIVEDGRDVEPGEPGEVVLRSPSIMLHYLNDPESTAEVLSTDGWLRTGDIGKIDDAGCLHIVGRSKDMFIVGGFNAYPAEIENILLGHPGIEQVTVIGVPDQRMGEVGMAFVVPARGGSVTEAEIIEWSREHMANYKAPRAVEIVSELPLNATGKVVREDLRARAASARSEASS